MWYARQYKGFDDLVKPPKARENAERRGGEENGSREEEVLGQSEQLGGGSKRHGRLIVDAGPKLRSSVLATWQTRPIVSGTVYHILYTMSRVVYHPRSAAQYSQEVCSALSGPYVS